MCFSVCNLLSILFACADISFAASVTFSFLHLDVICLNVDEYEIIYTIIASCSNAVFKGNSY